MSEEILSEQAEQLKQDILILQKEIDQVNTDWLFQSVFSRWFLKNKKEHSSDNDMSFIIFVYSLIINNEVFHEEETDSKVIERLVDKLEDVYNQSKTVCFLSKKSDSLEQFQEQNIYHHYQVFSTFREIYGILAYPYQLRELLDFFINNFDQYIIEKKGYSFKILKILQNKSMQMKKELFIENNIPIENKIRLSMNLLKYHTSLSISQEVKEVDEKAKILGIEDYNECGKWYNNFIKDFCCVFGDNSGYYIFPSDSTVLIQKPFIQLPYDSSFVINPLFTEVGYPMHLRDFDRWLISSLGNRYTKKKGKFIEKKVSDLLCRIFGEDNCYCNTYYKNTSDSPVELEVFVKYGDFILYFECKSNTIREKAKKDSRSYYSNIEDFVGKAGTQINNAQQFFKNRNVTIFPNDKLNNEQAVPINTKDNFVVLPIIITFTSFEHISGQSQELKSILSPWENLDNIPLLMSIFELETICKLLDKSYFFTDYILQRHNAINTPNNPFFSQIGTDELVQLGAYIKNNKIPFLDLKYEDTNILMCDSSLQNDIDLYFADIIASENIPSPKKPQPIIDIITLEFLNWVEQTKKIPKESKPLTFQWAICLFNLNTEIESLKNFIETYYNDLNDSSISDDYYQTRAGLLRSKYSDVDNPTMLFSFSVPKSTKYHGQCNKDYVQKKYDEYPTIVEFFCVSYDIHSISLDEKFDIFCCLPNCSPYDYLDISANK